MGKGRKLAPREDIAVKPIITADCVKTLLDTRFIKVFDLQYEEGKHYYDATRRAAGNLVAVKSDAEAAVMLPDAVSCFVIVILPGNDARLLLTQEYRYPAGRFLLSIPAGLIDGDSLCFLAPEYLTYTSRNDFHILTTETEYTAGENFVAKQKDARGNEVTKG